MKYTMSWISKNITKGVSSLTGQISNLTKDILTEGTEETSDHATQLTIAIENMTVLENSLCLIKAENEKLKAQNTDLDERAECAELQISNISRQYKTLLEEKEREVNSWKHRHSEAMENQSLSPLQDSVYASFTSSVRDNDFHCHKPDASKVDSLLANLEKELIYGWSGDVWGNDFNDNLQLQGEVNSLQKELSRLRSECSRYKSVVEELQGENYADLSSKDTNFLQLQANIKVLESQAVQYREDAQNHITSLDDAHRSKIASLKKQHDMEIDELKAGTSSLELQLDKSHKALLISKDFPCDIEDGDHICLKKEIERLEKELEAVVCENNELKLGMVELDEQHEKATFHMITVRDSLQCQLDASHVEITALHEELEHFVMHHGRNVDLGMRQSGQQNVKDFVVGFLPRLSDEQEVQRTGSAVDRKCSGHEVQRTGSVDLDTVVLQETPSMRGSTDVIHMVSGAAEEIDQFSAHLNIEHQQMYPHSSIYNLNPDVCHTIECSQDNLHSSNIALNCNRKHECSQFGQQYFLLDEGYRAEVESAIASDIEVRSTDVSQINVESGNNNDHFCNERCVCPDGQSLEIKPEHLLLTSEEANLLADVKAFLSSIRSSNDEDVYVIKNRLHDICRVLFKCNTIFLKVLSLSTLPSNNSLLTEQLVRNNCVDIKSILDIEKIISDAVLNINEELDCLQGDEWVIGPASNIPSNLGSDGLPCARVNDCVLTDSTADGLLSTCTADYDDSSFARGSDISIFNFASHHLQQHPAESSEHLRHRNTEISDSITETIFEQSMEIVKLQKCSRWELKEISLLPTDKNENSDNDDGFKCTSRVQASSHAQQSNHLADGDNALRECSESNPIYGAVAPCVVGECASIPSELCSLSDSAFCSSPIQLDHQCAYTCMECQQLPEVTDIQKKLTDITPTIIAESKELPELSSSRHDLSDLLGEINRLRTEHQQVVCMLEDKVRECDKLSHVVSRLMTIVSAQKSVPEELYYDQKTMQNDKSLSALCCRVDHESSQHSVQPMHNKGVDHEAMRQRNDTLVAVVGTLDSLQKEDGRHTQSVIPSTCNQSDAGFQLDELQLQYDKFALIVDEMSAKNVECCVGIELKVGQVPDSGAVDDQRVQLAYLTLNAGFCEKVKLLIEKNKDFFCLYHQFAMFSVKYSELLHNVATPDLPKVLTVDDSCGHQQIVLVEISEQNIDKGNDDILLMCAERQPALDVCRQKSESIQLSEFCEDVCKLCLQLDELTSKANNSCHAKQLAQQCYHTLESKASNDIAEHILNESSEKEVCSNIMHRPIQEISGILTCQESDATYTGFLFGDSTPTPAMLVCLKQEVELLSRTVDQKQLQLMAMCGENASLKDKEVKLMFDLERLRDHLVQVAEGYMQDNLEAEEREKSLRNKLADAESCVLTSTFQVQNASEEMTQQVQVLRQQLELAVSQRNASCLQAAGLQDQCQQYASSLLNLQLVLEQFQTDKERQIAIETERYEEESQNLRSSVEERNGEIRQLKAELHVASDGLAAASRLDEQLSRKETALMLLREEVLQKENLVQRAEQKLAELSTNKEAKVDRILMKNLLLGCLLTPPRNRPDAVHAIGSVLGFSSEDFRRSFSQLFVKFLETESSPVRIPVGDAKHGVHLHGASNMPAFNPFIARRVTAPMATAGSADPTSVMFAQPPLEPVGGMFQALPTLPTTTHTASSDSGAILRDVLDAS